MIIRSQDDGLCINSDLVYAYRIEKANVEGKQFFAIYCYSCYDFMNGLPLGFYSTEKQAKTAKQNLAEAIAKNRIQMAKGIDLSEMCNSLERQFITEQIYKMP